jgi:nicotinamidase-related amidase
LKALVIVDMQEDYIGEKSKYNFVNKQDTIDNINQRIANSEQSTAIIYMKNARKGVSSDLVKGLNVVSDLIFTKEKSSSFSSEEFYDYVNHNNIDEIEIVGIDGNCCIKATSVDGIKNGLQVTILLSCVGVINKDRFLKTRQALTELQVKIID